MENYCVCCGEIVPEGRMVCPLCEAKCAEQRPHRPKQMEGGKCAFHRIRNSGKGQRNGFAHLSSEV